MGEAAFHIVVPKALIEPLAKASIGERNAISTLLVLKSLDKSGAHRMDETKKRGCSGIFRLNIPHKIALSELLHITTKAVDYHVEAWLSMKLAYMNNRCELIVASYDDIAKFYGLRDAGNSRYLVKPTFRKLGYIIEKLCLEHEKERRKKAFRFKIDKIPFLKEDLTRIVGERKFSTDALWDKQLLGFQTGGSDVVDKDDLYVLYAHRADFNPNYDFMTQMFGYESKGGVAFLKRRLYRAGLLMMAHRSIELPKELYRSKRARTKSTAARFGKVWFDEASRGVKLHLCDQLELLNHNYAPTKEQVEVFSKSIGAKG